MYLAANPGYLSPASALIILILAALITILAMQGGNGELVQRTRRRKGVLPPAARTGTRPALALLPSIAEGRAVTQPSVPASNRLGNAIALMTPSSYDSLKPGMWLNDDAIEVGIS